MSGAWTLSGALLSVYLSGVCLCACLLSDGGMISDEGRELFKPVLVRRSVSIHNNHITSIQKYIG